MELAVLAVVRVVLELDDAIEKMPSCWSSWKSPLLTMPWFAVLVELELEL